MKSTEGAQAPLSELHIVGIDRSDKGRWVAASRAAGGNLESWVVATLNAASVNTNPEWLSGLSERAKYCLLSVKFYSRESVQRAINDGFDIASISNAGRKVKEEVLQWLKK